MMKKLISVLRSACIVAGMGAVACTSESGVELPQPARIEKIGSGDGQSATAGNRLEHPFSMRITAADATPVPRVAVRWEVIQGDGAVLSDSVTWSDGTGVAHTFLTLGLEIGEYMVHASLVDGPAGTLTYAVYAVPAPEISSVNPTTFSSGMQVTLVGSAFSDSVEIEIGGRRAVVNTISPTGQGLTAVVPACLNAGQVDIVARVGTAVSAAVTGTFEPSSDPLTLAAGEYVSLEPAVLQGCAHFGAAFGETGAEEREYLMAVHSVTDTRGEVLDFRFRGEVAAPSLALADRDDRGRTLAERFHDNLRELEKELGEMPREPLVVEGPQMAPLEAAVQVGDRRSFMVCDKVTCSTVEDFAAVTAEAKYVGNHAVIYEDLDAPPGGLTPADFEEMGLMFDEELYEVATAAFGSESDVDRNGTTLILLTPVVNGLTEAAECETSFITGFFFPIDIDPLYVDDARSNQAEIFYAMVPDPDGSVTCEHTVTRVKTVVPVTFIHELQHMINFSQHVVVRGSSSERTWLNEGMSHVAEELAALHFEALGDQTLFTRFAVSNLFNAYSFLEDPQQHFLIYRSGSGTLEERGSAWLFLRWLIDHYGEGVLRRLSESDLIGTENVMAATGESLDRTLADWFLANYVSDHPDLGRAPERLRYETWNFRETFLSLHEQDPNLFPREFPLVPQHFVGGSFNVTGTMRAGSGAYFRISQNPGQAGFSVEIVDQSDQPLVGGAEPRLTVIRIR